MVDYNEEEQIQAEITRLEAEQKSAQQKALKEMLANQVLAGYSLSTKADNKRIMKKNE